ncbi:MAG: adenylate/guanylate cyclase domain-containing protein [Alphaproteobacteria bacterium]|nr:adenylate/guanylate cyclase domain-containing protein [Alphaproteobacteria bacterium]
MSTPSAATPAEVTALRRRYLLMATSVAPIDAAITLVFMATSAAWSAAPVSLSMGLLLMLGVNFLLSRWLFQPIQDHLEGKADFDSTERRITQLPLLTARHVAILAFALAVFRFTTTYLTDPAAGGPPRSTPADMIAICVILPIFYFTYTYFVVCDYLAHLCRFVFQRYGRNLTLFYGRYTVKLIVALLVISVAPLAAIVVDFLSYDGERLQLELSNDILAVAIGITMSAYFITRSLLGPIRILSQAMGEVAKGDLGVRVPVTSNDEVGSLTGQFNTMVEGLRERERIRETFGRYVDESVAATILQREGAGVLAGETREATILFTDIAGFTTIAEYLTPEELVAALNEYLETVIEPIRVHGGVVNTFIGDGLFASFNMPLACADHARAAVRAAIDIQRAVGDRTFGDLGVAFATRIGISTGQVIGGSVGAGQRVSFTLLGDTVNLAARLEQLNKEYGTRILVSDSTRRVCGEAFAFTAHGSVVVRGRSDAATLFSVDPNSQEKP